jgi:hypothetical protein
LIFKKRNVPKELQLLRALRPRMNFTEEEESYYQYKEKGYLGEVNFDKWADPLKDMIFLHDATFTVHNNHFQNDSLGITAGTLHIFEIKNFEGDYLIKKDKWHSPKGNAVKNPLLQLEKAETLINQLVKSMGWRIFVKPHLVFVHPEFHLYDVPSTLPIVYPSQLMRFREKLQQQSSKPTRPDIQLAEKLCSLLKDDLPYTSVPAFTYEGLRKGIVCPGCGVFYGSVQTTLICKNCGKREKCTEAVLRSVREFRLLFPNLKMTTNTIYNWCGTFKDIRTIQTVLRTNFTLKGHGKSAHYL